MPGPACATNPLLHSFLSGHDRRCVGRGLVGVGVLAAVGLLGNFEDVNEVVRLVHIRHGVRLLVLLLAEARHVELQIVEQVGGPGA